jgi:hypothetical protein
MANPNGGGQQGSFNVYTQNMQGGSNVGYAVGQIRQHDVTMLQESGMPGFVAQSGTAQGNGLITGTHNFGTRSRPDNFEFVHYPNGRCSITTLISENVAQGQNVNFGTIPAPSATLRPMLTAEVNGTTFGNFHAPSGNHNAARGVLNSQLNLLEQQSQNFITGGDANSDVHQQTNGSRTAFSTGEATHQSGGQLDGFIVSNQYSGNLRPIGQGGSDHIGTSGQFQ